MAGNKYLSQSSGVVTEVASSQTSAGAGDAGKIVALNSAGSVDVTMLPTGVGPDTVSVTASEALSAGNLVNIYNNAGTANCRKADASTSGKEAWGYVLAAVSSSATATIYLSGLNTAVTGLTPGKQFLSDTTPGAATTTAASGTGHVSQVVGVASAAASLQFDPQTAIVLA
jgi:hypothetical protein